MLAIYNSTRFPFASNGWNFKGRRQALYVEIDSHMSAPRKDSSKAYMSWFTRWPVIRIQPNCMTKNAILLMTASLTRWGPLFLPRCAVADLVWKRLWPMPSQLSLLLLRWQRCSTRNLAPFLKGNILFEKMGHLSVQVHQSYLFQTYCMILQFLDKKNKFLKSLGYHWYGWDIFWGQIFKDTWSSEVP